MTEDPAEHEFVVVGGGIAGICAALAAARHGARTALIERDGTLGGESGARGRQPIVGSDVWGRRPNGRETGILEELRLENAARNPEHDWSIWEGLLNEWIRREPNLTLCLGCEVSAVELRADGGIAAAATLAGDRIVGALFADCTGSGALGIAAGADRRSDLESRSEFGEPLAPEAGGGAAPLRLLGDAIVTELDLRDGRIFDDEVAYGGWPIQSGGFSAEWDDSRAEEWLAGFYSIPLRALYSRTVPNLFMAGPIASATAIAARSMAAAGTGAVMGQAIGTAAALCRRGGVGPRELASARIWELQQALLKDDAFLVGHLSEDPNDLARFSRAVATSKLGPDFIPSNVINGLARPTDDWPQIWASDPKIGFPTNLEIDFVERRTVDTVYLTFDTGLGRPLAITDDPSLRARMVNGPQPETVADYTILAGLTTRWNPIVEVRGNVLRRRAHRFDPVRVNRLRVVVHRTNGVDHARIAEVRCYQEGS